MPPYTLKHIIPSSGATIISVELNETLINADIDHKKREYIKSKMRKIPLPKNIS